MVGMRGTGWECAVHGGNARYRVGMRGIGWECVVHGGNAWYTVGMRSTWWEGTQTRIWGKTWLGTRRSQRVCVHKGDRRLSEGRGPLLSFHMLSDSSFIKLQ